MIETQNSKKYDLDERTELFAQRCRAWVKKLSKTIGNIEDGKQLVRSSGSVAANYIEASESLSQKDFYHRMKICRKEAKESRLWLTVMDTSGDRELELERSALKQESEQLTRIFGSIVEKGKAI